MVICWCDMTNGENGLIWGCCSGDLLEWRHHWWSSSCYGAASSIKVEDGWRRGERDPKWCVALVDDVMYQMMDFGNVFCFIIMLDGVWLGGWHGPSTVCSFMVLDSLWWMQPDDGIGTVDSADGGRMVSLSLSYPWSWSEDDSILRLATWSWWGVMWHSGEGDVTLRRMIVVPYGYVQCTMAEGWPGEDGGGWPLLVDGDRWHLVDGVAWCPISLAWCDLRMTVAFPVPHK